MDLSRNLIESKKQRREGGWQASITSLILHVAFISSIILAGAATTHRINAQDKPIRVYVSQAAAALPPPPPPSAAASSSTPKATPHVQPQPVVHDALTPPQEIPKEIPSVNNPQPAPETPADSSSSGVPGGVAGGVEGGVVGGQAGGEVGGVLGGVIGGTAGGTVGGTGTGNGDAAPAPEAPSGPVRVGGDVKAPVAIDHPDPRYTDTARNAHVSGVVILEAIIDKTGHVDQVKVLKGLPMGLSDEAERAVRQWRFKPGTMNGQPVDVIFDLTVNFTLQ